MSDAFRITANLPSRDFAKTREFYARLGFEDRFISDQWMVLGQGEETLEFFPFPKLNPWQSSFSACFRSNDLETLYENFLAADLTSKPTAIPRLQPIETIPNGPRIFYLVDLDGTLIRCTEDIQNERSAT